MNKIMTQKEKDRYKLGDILTSRTIDLMQRQLIFIQSTTKLYFIHAANKALGTAKYYGKSQIDEVKDIWYNYDHPEN